MLRAEGDHSKEKLTGRRLLVGVFELLQRHDFAAQLQQVTLEMLQLHRRRALAANFCTATTAIVMLPSTAAACSRTRR